MPSPRPLPVCRCRKYQRFPSRADGCCARSECVVTNREDVQRGRFLNALLCSLRPIRSFCTRRRCSSYRSAVLSPFPCQGASIENSECWPSFRIGAPEGCCSLSDWQQVVNLRLSKLEKDDFYASNHPLLPGAAPHLLPAELKEALTELKVAIFECWEGVGPHQT